MPSMNVVTAPAEWARYHKEVLGNPPDENLIGMEKLINWVIACGVTDEAGIRKTFKRLGAYVYLRCMYPIVPVDPWSYEMFRINLHFTVAGYIVDDRIECYTMEEIDELCDGYAMLEKEVKKNFPKCPSIEEMKESLKHLKKKFSIAAITMVMDYVNQSALLFLREGKKCKERADNYRQRLTNAVSIYYQAIKNKIKTGTYVTEGEMLWRRCFDVLALPAYVVPEYFTRAGEAGEFPVRLLYELYMHGILYSTIINDLYSYHREKFDNCDNVIKVWLQENPATSVEDANKKICKILDAILQFMFEKMEEAKAKYPNDLELQALLDYTAYVTVGWIFVHNTAAPRYRESPYQVSLTEIQENEIPKWLKEKDEFGWDTLRQFSKKMNSGKGILIADALCGFGDGEGLFEDTTAK